MKLCEYEIVTSGELSLEKSTSTLKERVNRLLYAGWEPSGGISVISVKQISGEPFYESSQALKRLRTIE